MKQVLLILSVVCLQAAFGDYTEADMPPEERACLKELNLPASVMLENYNEDWTVLEGNSDINNVMKCSFVKFNYLKADDTMDYDKFKDMLVNELFKMANMTFDNPEEVAASSIDPCKATQGNDVADTLVKFYNCVIKFLRNQV